MAYVRGAVALGLAKRAEHGLKVRQPLASVTILNAFLEAPELPYYLDIVKEELNVKKILARRSGDLSATESRQLLAEPGYGEQDGGQVKLMLDLKLTPALRREGKMREVVRNVQGARKKASLNIDNRIKLALSTTDDELRKAIEEHREIIKAETLAEGLVFDRTFAYEMNCTVDGAPLTISLEKS